MGNACGSEIPQESGVSRLSLSEDEINRMRYESEQQNECERISLENEEKRLEAERLAKLELDRILSEEEVLERRQRETDIQSTEDDEGIIIKESLVIKALKLKFTPIDLPKDIIEIPSPHGTEAERNSINISFSPKDSIRSTSNYSKKDINIECDDLIIDESTDHRIKKKLEKEIFRKKKEQEVYERMAREIIEKQQYTGNEACQILQQKQEEKKLKEDEEIKKRIIENVNLEKFLMKNGFPDSNINAKKILNSFGGRYTFPIHVAIEKQDIDIIRILLKNGADPNIKTKAGKTPLDRAKNINNEQIIQLFQDFVGSIAV